MREGGPVDEEILGVLRVDCYLRLPIVVEEPFRDKFNCNWRPTDGAPWAEALVATPQTMDKTIAASSVRCRIQS